MSTGSRGSGFTVIPYSDLICGKIIASGGFGEVYRGDHKVWAIPIAIKFIHLNRPISASDEDTMSKEASKLYEAQFKYVLQLYGVTKRDLGNGTSSLGIVTELAENGSLDKIMQRPSVPWALRLRFIYEIALGMNYLHSLNPPLLHCDLKPANILLNMDYHVKIADFGMAEWRRVTQQYSSKENKGGTLNYIAPEYLEDINRRADTKIDVYSFAIVLWEILSGQTPYENAFGPDLVSLGVKQGQRPALEAIPEEKPSVDQLTSLLKKCWEQNPEKRPSFADCITELKPIQPSDNDVRATIQEDLCCVDAAPSPKESGRLTESKESIKLSTPVQETHKTEDPDIMVTLNESLDLANGLQEDWKFLARRLGLSEGDIAAIDSDYQHGGLVEKGYQTVQTWQQHQGKKATCARLKSCLAQMGRVDLLKIFK